MFVPFLSCPVLSWSFQYFLGFNRRYHFWDIITCSYCKCVPQRLIFPVWCFWWMIGARFFICPVLFCFFSVFLGFSKGRKGGRKEGRKEGTKEGWKDGRKEASKEGRRNLRPTYMFFGHRSKTKLTWTLNRSNPKPIFNRSDKAPQNKHREILNHEVYKVHAIDNPVSTMFNQQHCVSEKVSTCFGWEALLSFFLWRPTRSYAWVLGTSKICCQDSLAPAVAAVIHAFLIQEHRAIMKHLEPSLPASYELLVLLLLLKLLHCPCHLSTHILSSWDGSWPLLCGGLELVAWWPNDPAALQVGPCGSNAGSWELGTLGCWVR